MVAKIKFVQTTQGVLPSKSGNGYNIPVPASTTLTQVNAANGTGVPLTVGYTITIPPNFVGLLWCTRNTISFDPLILAPGVHNNPVLKNCRTIQGGDTSMTKDDGNFGQLVLLRSEFAPFLPS